MSTVAYEILWRCPTCGQLDYNVLPVGKIQAQGHTPAVCVGHNVYGPEGETVRSEHDPVAFVPVSIMAQIAQPQIPPGLAAQLLGPRR